MSEEERMSLFSLCDLGRTLTRIAALIDCATLPCLAGILPEVTSAVGGRCGGKLDGGLFLKSAVLGAMGRSAIST